MCVSIGVHAALIVAAVAAPARSLLDDAPVTVEIVDAGPAAAGGRARRAAAEAGRDPAGGGEAGAPRRRADPAARRSAAAAGAGRPSRRRPSPAPRRRRRRKIRARSWSPPRPRARGSPAAARRAWWAGAAPVGVASEGQRRDLADRYRDDLLRTRIRDHFRYPAEARDLELTGRVVVQVTVDRNGRLLAARIAGSCPHRLLCDDGLRTVRASAPFPALPADLGDSLRIEIPLKYDFQ